MALGKIVIAAIHSGVAALIKNEVNGFAIDAHSQSQIPDILESIINGAVAVDDLSKNAVLSVKHLTWEYASEKHYQAYIDLYNLPKARAV
jgi:glycosyltransferase involved in cell wall biosynthesis